MRRRGGNDFLPEQVLQYMDDSLTRHSGKQAQVSPWGDRDFEFSYSGASRDTPVFMSHQVAEMAEEKCCIRPRALYPNRDAQANRARILAAALATDRAPVSDSGPL